MIMAIGYPAKRWNCSLMDMETELEGRTIGIWLFYKTDPS
jgi:hypothetical protein